MGTTLNIDEGWWEKRGVCQSWLGLGPMKIKNSEMVAEWPQEFVGMNAQTSL